jgi:predicted ArsR family transcriptional regulator
MDPLSAMADPVRRRLYEFVASSGRPVGRDEAAKAAGVQRSLAAYHLDALAESGLLDVSYMRLNERSGPGAGRPAKLYRPAEQEFAFHAPARDYRLLAELLARVATDEGRSLEEVALEAGRELGAAAEGDDVEDVLRGCGYAPFEAAPGVLRLRNCPFDTVAKEHPELVCVLNAALVRGLLEGAGAAGSSTLEPEPGMCCVAIRDATTRGAPGSRRRTASASRRSR